MDTGTHVVMGVALGGIATLDPAVSSDPALFNAVLIGTLVGSPGTGHRHRPET